MSTRPAALGQVGGFRPPDDPRTSRAGGVLVGARGEGWPRQDGEPMLALTQVNVTELPVVPPALEPIALLTLFVGPRELPIDTPNGDNWCLRTYATLDELGPLEEPPAARAGDPKRARGDRATYRPFPVRWSAIDDDEDDPAPGLKLGGWPHTVQGELGWDAEPVLQVDSDGKTGFEVGFAGVLHVGRARGGDGAWVVTWQSM